VCYSELQQVAARAEDAQCTDKVVVGNATTRSGESVCFGKREVREKEEENNKGIQLGDKRSEK